MKEKKKSKKIFIDNKYKEKRIELLEFVKLSNEDQNLEIEKTLNEMYEEKVKITKGMINKCIKLSISKHDDYMILSHNLVVEKNAKSLTFKFEKRISKMPLIILFLFILLAALISATYLGLLYLRYSNLNKDIDGDGIADINLDLDGDYIADINIDIDGDDIPDLNIDYKGNKHAIFSLDTDGDGIADFNLVNDATNDIDSCTVNCDLNGDGWPNQNYDIDGDGVADFDIYDVVDKVINKQIDIDGDLVCDIMCDDDGDGICDRNCIFDDVDIAQSGTSSVLGNQNSNIESGSLIVQYSGSGDFYVSNIFPDDQGIDDDYPYNTFTVTNLSDFTISYKITMVVNENTYTSDNFMYKIESTNDGYNADFVTAPWDDTLVSSYVTIAPYETQNYTITFKLQGIGEEQNYDQGKIFSGYIKIGD